jgi:CheY-like chemotaxis protein
VGTHLAGLDRPRRQPVLAASNAAVVGRLGATYRHPVPRLGLRSAGSRRRASLCASFGCYIVGPEAAPEAPRRTDEMPTRILIADDNRDAADTMGMLLELGGHEVIVAHSGNQALELGRQRRPAVVILDIGMPDMNGYDVARTARNEDWGKSAYMIALTGWGQAEDKERARMAGFDRHLTKPVDPDLVEEILREYLIGKQAT